MSDKKKLVLLELNDAIYKNLKRSALQSCRAIGNEVALRIEHALNEFQGVPMGFSSMQLDKVSMHPVGRVVQVQLKEEVHIKLKTMASASNIFMKEFATLRLTQSLERFEFIANTDNAILKTAPANAPAKAIKSTKMLADA